MIYCTNEIRAKVWYVGEHNNCLMVSISTSEKTRNGEYKNSSWFAECYGKAADVIMKLQKGDSILIKRCALRNVYSKKNERQYFSMSIYEAEQTNILTSDETQAQPCGELEEINPDDDLPF